MSSSIILDSMREVFEQGESLLLTLDDVAYAAKIPGAFNASVGGHYRHCLDHFYSVFYGLEHAEVNYDNRRRDPLIESVREVALAHTKDLLRASERLEEQILTRSTMVRSKVSYSMEESPAVSSTLGRELMFCVVHAIHHYALMGMMCGMLKVPLPEGFGVAPSTVKHHRETARLAA